MKKHQQNHETPAPKFRKFVSFATAYLRSLKIWSLTKIAPFFWRDSQLVDPLKLQLRIKSVPAESIEPRKESLRVLSFVGIQLIELRAEKKKSPEILVPVPWIVVMFL